MSRSTRTIQLDYLARVEGETALTIRLEQGRPPEVRLAIFEPPRFFEALLVGRSFREAPDVTSRICGICPVAYLMSACQAMEQAIGITVTGQLRALRRLLYLGEWIESHTLHAFLLHAPDFLGYPDVAAMAKDHGDWVKRGLSIKQAGNEIVCALGGRAIHPVNVQVGGFYRAPPASALRALLPRLRAAGDAARACLEWMSGFAFPALERDVEWVSLRHPDEYPLQEGRIVSSRGLDLPASEFGDHFVEEQVAHSTALRCRVRARGAYLCGPLARYNLNFDRLLPEVQSLAPRIGLPWPCTNPFQSLLVRMIEVLQCLLEAVAIIEAYQPPPHANAPASPRVGVGHGATEAPRGLLYHRYALDEHGGILEVRIVPPTSQNQLAIEEDLASQASELLALPLAQATARAERAVRNYDPCISCATHFLTLRVEKSPCAAG